MSNSGIRATLSALWSPILAITTADGERVNGQIALAGLNASILPEAPRVLIELWKANLTHDMVLSSGVFALHVLPTEPEEALLTSLSLVRRLGMRSGRDGDKMHGIPARSGVTGSPILLEALSYVEARVAATLDGDEMTIFLADAVAGERLRQGDALTLRMTRERMPAEWMEEWERNQKYQLDEARRRRGESF